MSKFSFSQRLKSFGFAINGLKIFFATQHNTWIHIAAAIAVILAGWYFHLSTIEWCFVASAIAAVLIAEAFNTALEFLTDLVSPDYNKKAGQVKDLAAAAVMVAAIYALIIALFVFGGKL